MGTEVIVMKWGNSLGVILPEQLVKKEKLKENEKILVNIVKESKIKSLFNTLPRKLTGQKFKDLVRQGWEQ